MIGKSLVSTIFFVGAFALLYALTKSLCIGFFDLNVWIFLKISFLVVFRWQIHSILMQIANTELVFRLCGHLRKEWQHDKESFEYFDWGDFGRGVLAFVFVGGLLVVWPILSERESGSELLESSGSRPRHESQYDRDTSTSASKQTNRESSEGMTAHDSGFQFGMQSDGNDWCRAPDQAKRKLCEALSQSSRNGNSQNYFYDALNEFYRTDNTKNLSTKLDDITRVIENGGRLLPRDERDY